MPVGRRVEQQERPAVPAKARRDQQRARPHRVVTCQRRDAEEVERIVIAQRKEPGALDRGADDVVVGQRSAVIAIGVRIHVGGERAAIAAVGRHRSLQRHGALQADQRGLRQQRRHRPRRVRVDRQARIDLLVLDVLRARRTHPLDDQVELVGVGRIQVVVVDRGAQELAGARALRLQRQRRELGRGQRQRRRAAAVDDPDDAREPTAVLEELLNRV